MVITLFHNRKKSEWCGCVRKIFRENVILFSMFVISMKIRDFSNLTKLVPKYKYIKPRVKIPLSMGSINTTVNIIFNGGRGKNQENFFF